MNNMTSFVIGRLVLRWAAVVGVCFLLINNNNNSSNRSFFVDAAGGTVQEGFIDEIVTTVKAMSGAFAPNPRNGGKPMMILNAKNGQITVVENPDESSDSLEILDLNDYLCTNGERGLHTVIPHPNFLENRWVYAFYTEFKEGCAEDLVDGPSNVVVRFTLDADTLLIDYNNREEIWRGTCRCFLEVTPVQRLVFVVSCVVIVHVSSNLSGDFSHLFLSSVGRLFSLLYHVIKADRCTNVCITVVPCYLGLKTLLFYTSLPEMLENGNGLSH
jgi:Glucose / Sorbosone dehydrogenase